MKDIVKSMLILVVIYLLLFFLVNTNRQSQTKQPEPKDIIISDTITKVVYDTVFIDHFETVKLPVVDTLILINDSIRVDSVFVEVPISIYKFDTTFSTDTTSLNIHIQNSGYAVTLDSLSYYFEYAPTKTKKIRWFIGPSLGIGYDFTSGKLIPTIGIGIILKRF